MDAELFSLRERSAVVMGGSGTLGRAIAQALAQCGARVAIGGRSSEKSETVAAAIRHAGAEAMVLHVDALDRPALERARSRIVEVWGGFDVLVNATGGNIPGATLATGESALDLDAGAFRAVVDANLMGALLPTQVFAAALVAAGRGSVINISSMAASRPLTRVAGYGAAKAALENLTRWLAVNLAQTYGDAIRVNAVAPGFFLGDQNRGLLLNAAGELTERGNAIIEHTPMGRFGDPEDLVGAVCWLASDASRFVTGAVIPVDGGFSAFAGV
jgi:NAD(P)-dependent dehydrogenase (short-subunit alcohol dehydrogenase family)